MEATDSTLVKKTVQIRMADPRLDTGTNYTVIQVNAVGIHVHATYRNDGISEFIPWVQIARLEYADGGQSNVRGMRG
jgi:hypothetical protein